METYRAIYIGDEFPEFTGQEVAVWDDHRDPDAPCYAMELDGQEFGNMSDEDFEFID